ncbi:MULTISPECIES: ABC transporter substrate-binding protein [unclassified Clostridioides]|uniref:ABC transporter substrate-binding protein n=1 Tax=unclassified Clostridioides TaxID=2635829 RepID=UPI0007BB7410|nr:ABC transporter substrate-binding protein [Clostridioides sp. ZZV14-6387]MDB3083781.1 ABC transporter substrate-binding protein [Clostridioides difficile]CZR96251.1 ABC transporter substrate binding protein [Clostridioides difficile]CZS01398.1 ABC transporter substrate binding protein [Clostridioides difficile]
MKRSKLINLTLIGVLSISTITGCSKNNEGDLDESSSKNNDIKKIGITQLVEHQALDASKEGFVKALEDNGFKDGKNIEIDYQNAQNDMPTTQTIASKFVSDKKDLIFAISTPSAQAAYNATKDIPILITAVTDPVSAGFADSLDNPGKNVSGTSNFTPIEKSMEALDVLVPKAKTIGVIYNTSEVNSKVQVDNLKKYATNKGLKIVEKGISSSSEINQAASSLMGNVDVIYAPTDNLLASSMPIVSELATKNKIPIIAAEEGMVKGGALACQGINYEKLGYKTGEMAVKVLKGESKVSDMPITSLDETNLIINEDILKALSIDKPSDNNIVYVKTENK